VNIADNGAAQLFQLRSRSLATLDANGDDALDLTEIMTLLSGKNSPAKSAGLAKTATEQTLATLDTDSNGTISQAELRRDKDDVATSLQLTLAQLSGNLLKNWWSDDAESQSDSAFKALTGTGGQRGDTAGLASAGGSAPGAGGPVDSIVARYRHLQSATAMDGVRSPMA
jgi:hypothetical protein